VKVGDLVMRTDDLVRESLGAGVVIQVEENDKYSLFCQVKWSRNVWDLHWYEKPDLEIISESR